MIKVFDLAEGYADIYLYQIELELDSRFGSFCRSIFVDLGPSFWASYSKSIDLVDLNKWNWSNVIHALISDLSNELLKCSHAKNLRIYPRISSCTEKSLCCETFYEVINCLCIVSNELNEKERKMFEEQNTLDKMIKLRRTVRLKSDPKYPLVAPKQINL